MDVKAVALIAEIKEDALQMGNHELAKKLDELMRMWENETNDR